VTNPVIDSDGNQRWLVNRKLHRVDGPAVIYADGEQQWRVHGRLHRTDGPAIICIDGTQYWYVNDQSHTNSKSYQGAAKLSDEEMTLLILKYGAVK